MYVSNFKTRWKFINTYYPRVRSASALHIYIWYIRVVRCTFFGEVFNKLCSDLMCENPNVKNNNNSFGL